MKQLQSLTLFVASSLVLASCAHESKVSSRTDYGHRVTKRGVVSTGMPNYVLAPEIYTAVAGEKPLERTPASDADLARELEQADKLPSLRRLYFRALYQQYRELQSAVAKGEELKSCPQFHHDKLIVDESSRAQLPLQLSTARPLQSQLAFYPEWMLPAKSTRVAAPIWKRKGDPVQLLGRGLKVHAKKIRRELSTLCEDGTSDAYFRLENMVTYFAGRPEVQAKMGLESFLKIPAFSTMLLLRSTQSASKHDHFNEHDRALINEVHGGNFERYINELRKRRFQATTSAL